MPLHSVINGLGPGPGLLSPISRPLASDSSVTGRGAIMHTTVRTVVLGLFGDRVAPCDGIVNSCGYFYKATDFYKASFNLRPSDSFGCLFQRNKHQMKLTFYGCFSFALQVLYCQYMVLCAELGLIQFTLSCLVLSLICCPNVNLPVRVFNVLQTDLSLQLKNCEFP